MNAEYKWYEAYKAAVLETDWTKMDDRIDVAKSSIKLRLNELSMDHGGTPEERQSLADALNALEVLRRDAASWSQRESKLT
jgi:hypothetical protein